MSASLQNELLAQAGSDADVHTASTAVEEHEPSLLSYDPGVGIWTIGIFVILLLVLKKYAWKPILASLDAREKTIKDSLDQAAHIQAENARLAEEQRLILAEAKSQAAVIVQTARETADMMRRSVEDAAQREKKRILASAEQEIEASKQNALADLKLTMADFSIHIAEKLLRQNLDDAKNRALVDQLLRELEAKA